MTNRHHSPLSAGAIRTGKSFLGLVFLALVALVGQGCREQFSSKPRGFQMSCFSSGPTDYHRVAIDSTVLKYTYYEAPDTLVWVMQAPCYADSDLKTVTASLSQESLDKLAGAVNRSGFLRLPDTCGRLDRTPCSPVELSAGRCCDTKKVVYLNGPMPQAFRDVTAALASLVQAKFGRTFALYASQAAELGGMVLRSKRSGPDGRGS